MSTYSGDSPSPAALDLAYKLVREYERHEREQDQLEEPTLTVWHSMRSRCNNPKAPGYQKYGGQGIRVLDRWNNSYAAFKEDMGPRPAGSTIERIDHTGHYKLDNCRWREV